VDLLEDGISRTEGLTACDPPANGHQGFEPPGRGPRPGPGHCRLYDAGSSTAAGLLGGVAGDRDAPKYPCIIMSAWPEAKRGSAHSDGFALSSQKSVPGSPPWCRLVADQSSPPAGRAS